MDSLDLFRKGVDELKDTYVLNESREFAFILIEHLFKLSKTQILANRPLDLNGSDINVFHNYIERLKCHEPIQYITGEAHFLDFTFKVTPDVLIPRGETEELVMHIFEKFKDYKTLKILDLCAGSGCIGISLAKLLPSSSVTCLDISEAALKVAQYNAENIGVHINWLKADVLSDPLHISGYDVVASNPPYVMDAEKTTMSENVLQHEPHLALFVPDNNPLLFYETIAHKSNDLLKPKGYLAFEINSQFGKETASILYKHGFENIEIVRDIHGKDRFVTGERGL